MTTQKKSGIFIIGGGRAGSALAWYFIQNNLPPDALVETNPERHDFLKKEFHWNFIHAKIQLKDLEKSTIVILTVPDDNIAALCRHLITLPIHWKQKMVVHCSGAQPKSVLQPLEERGAITASFHPIYSFAINPSDNLYLKEAWIDIETDKAGQKILEQVFWFHKDKFFIVDPTSKLQFHLASVYFSNFLVALSDVGLEIIHDIGESEPDLFKIFEPLIYSTLAQIKNNGIRDAVTGPASRGDLETIKKHIEMLQSQNPDALEIYLILTQKIIALQKLPLKRQNMILDYLKSL